MATAARIFSARAAPTDLYGFPTILTVDYKKKEKNLFFLESLCSMKDQRVRSGRLHDRPTSLFTASDMRTGSPGFNCWLK